MRPKVYGINWFMNTTLRLDRLRFATSNFFNLQGLRQVALGVMLLVAIPLGGLENIWRFTLLLGVPFEYASTVN